MQNCNTICYKTLTNVLVYLGIVDMENMISVLQESWLFYLVCLCFAVLLAVGLSKIWRDDSPPGPFGLPLVGSLLHLGDSPHLALSKMAKVYGSVFSIRLGWRKAIVLNSQEVVKEALSKKAGHFSGRPPFHNFQISSNGGKSIAFGDFGPLHQRNKKLATRALHSVFSDVNRFNTLAQQETEKLCSLLTESTSEAHDLTPYLKNAVINFAFRLVFGDNLKEDHTVAFQNLIKKANDFIENNAAINLLDFFPWLHFALRKQCRAMKASVKELLDFVGNVYRLQRHADVKEAGVNVAASLEHIIREEMLSAGKHDVMNKATKQQASEMPLDEDALVMILADTFGAGIETVSTALSWAMLLVLSEPGLQEDLQAELKREIGTDRLPTLQDRARLPLLQATVLEVLRKSTVIPLALPHYTTEDSTVGGYHVPKGTTVLVNLWAVHHDPENFDQPEIFNPYRFLDEDGQLLVNQQALLLPFSTGARRCLGATLAKAQLFMFLGCLLQRLHFQLSTNNEPLNLDGMYGLTLKPYPFKVQINARNFEQ